jgi:hypothetical protein
MTARLAAWPAAVAALRPHLLFDETVKVLETWSAMWPDPPVAPPERRLIDPLAMIGSLPHVFVIRVEPETGALRYRLAGEAINSRYETGIIGLTLADITPTDALARVDGYFRICPDRPAAVLVSGLLFAERDTPGYGERLLLPIKDTDVGTVGILGITYQSRLFPDSATARSRAERTLRVFPLDGGPMEETDASV